MALNQEKQEKGIFTLVRGGRIDLKKKGEKTASYGCSGKKRRKQGGGSWGWGKPTMAVATSAAKRKKRKKEKGMALKMKS